MRVWHRCRGGGKGGGGESPAARRSRFSCVRLPPAQPRAQCCFPRPPRSAQPHPLLHPCRPPAQVYAQRRPGLNRLLDHEDELFFLITALLDRAALAGGGGSFAEGLYGLRRAPAGTPDRPPSPGQRTSSLMLLVGGRGCMAGWLVCMACRLVAGVCVPYPCASVAWRWDAWALACRRAGKEEQQAGRQAALGGPCRSPAPGACPTSPVGPLPSRPTGARPLCSCQAGWPLPAPGCAVGAGSGALGPPGAHAAARGETGAQALQH